MAATLRQDLATPLFADVDLLGMLPYKGKIDSLMRKTEIVQAIASLRARGSDAHLWLPGVGTLNGLTTGNYLESTGNTLGTVDNPCGLVLDALGSVSEIDLLDGSGSFDNPSDWTIGGSPSWTVSGGVISANAVAWTAGVTKLIPVSAGKTYVVEGDVTKVTGNPMIYIGEGQQYFMPEVSGHFHAVLTCGTSPYRINISAHAFVGTIDNISVREVSGIHLTQTTTANKPVLRRGAYNYLLNSVLAGGTSGVEGSGAVAPTGWVFPANTGQVTFSGTSVRFVASTQRPFIGETTGSIGVGNYIFSTKVEAIAVAAQISDLVSASNGTGTITINSYKRNNVAALASENVALGDTISVLVSVTVAGTIQPRFGPGISGTVTADITLSNPQLETGSTASDYSPTTTAAASNPDAGKYSWAFDGSNDSLALGSVPFQMGDDFAVVCSAKSGTLVGWASIFSLSGAGTTPRIQLLLNNADGHAMGYFRDDTGNFSQVNGAADLRNTNIVISLLKRGNDVYLRVNGQQVGSASVSTLGATTFTGAGVGYLFLGTDYWVGTIYHCSPIKGTVSDADLLIYEKLAASAAGITI